MPRQQQATAINRDVLKNVKIYRRFIQSPARYLSVANDSSRMKKSFPRLGVRARIKKKFFPFGESTGSKSRLFVLPPSSSLEFRTNDFELSSFLERFFGARLIQRLATWAIINFYRRYALISPRFLRTDTCCTRRLEKMLLINRRVAGDVGRV